MSPSATRDDHLGIDPSKYPPRLLVVALVIEHHQLTLG